MSDTPTPTPPAVTLVPIRAFRTPVRGHAFAAPPPGGERPAPGALAELAREPDNPADPLAIAVWAAPSTGARWRIGYLDRGVAARLAPRLDGGVRVRAQLDGWSHEPDGRWRRPLLLLLPEDPPATPSSTVPSERAARPSSVEDEAEAALGPGRLWGRPPGVRRRRIR